MNSTIERIRVEYTGDTANREVKLHGGSSGCGKRSPQTMKDKQWLRFFFFLNLLWGYFSQELYFYFQSYSNAPISPWKTLPVL